MSSPFASPSKGGWNYYLSSWLGGTSPPKASASQEDDETPQQPAAKRRKTEGEPETAATATPTSTSTSTSTAPTLEKVMEAIREHTTKAREHHARAEERERLAKARAERIESLLERVLEKLNDAAAWGTEATGVATGEEMAEDEDEDEDEEENEDEDENPDGEESGDEEEDEDESTTSETEASASAPASLTTPARGTSRRYIPRSSGKTWTTNEREVVVKGVAVYGKDYKAVARLLKYRNYDQTRGFFRRNDDYIDRESSKHPCGNETDKQALLEAIRRIDQDDDGPDEESSDGDDGETLRSGIWSQREFALAAKGLAIHGLNDFDAIAAIVGTRTSTQTKRFVIRRYDELREVPQEE